MLDYADAVVAAAARTAAPAALVGWSMGGLAVLMAADRVQPSCLVLLESSPPGETQGFATAGPEIEGTFDPEAVYGAFPVGVGSRHESLRARAERKHGISVPHVSCPTLVVTSREFEGERGDPVARLYGAERLHFPDLDHWGLVLDPRVPPPVAAYLSRLRSSEPERTGSA